MGVVAGGKLVGESKGRGGGKGEGHNERERRGGGGGRVFCIRRARRTRERGTIRSAISLPQIRSLSLISHTHVSARE
jgi:hypothetical protein